ncbi:MAG: lamin tail domain-containing protein [Paludibacter sp.]|nr:lamin tail domain-containing protein [Paludibacter sp.]
MQKVFFLILVCTFSVSVNAQFFDDFSDGDFTQNPQWIGITDNFFINSNLQLQSCASTASTSYLFTFSQAMDNAVWQADVQINYLTSANNYASIYLISNNLKPDTCYAYYVQIGGTNDEVSLFLQQGTKKTKIIDGIDKRIDYQLVILTIRVTRDSEGNFALYSKKPDEDDFYLEGTTFNNAVVRGNYFGVLYSNTNTTGNNYFFDNIEVTGDIPPEPKVYLKPQFGDITFNEVMFNTSEEVPEYIEIANLTSDTLDISNLKLTNLRTDGSYNTFVEIPSQTILYPNDYAAFCNDAIQLYYYFNLSEESAKIYTTVRWNALNNEGATIILLDENAGSEFDSFTYSPKMHYILLNNTRNVSLEKINPKMPSNDINSWHSAAFDVNYGTPGYKNSQYHELQNNKNDNRIWLETEYFSPDNDGYNDLCYIYYATELIGSTANAVIFDALGNRIKQLCNNVLLSSEGFLTWDGTRQDGKMANPAVYVLYFQFFNPNTAEKKEIKLPIVLTMR